jgi:hypothetical protein
MRRNAIRRWSASVAVAGLTAALFVGFAPSASAGTSPFVAIDAVIVGTPTGPLAVTLTCDDFGPTEFAVTGSGPVAGTPVTPYSDAGQTCTLTATQTAGATVSFACATTNDAVITCSAPNALTDTTGGTATGTITATFAFADPAPAVESQPRTVG